MGDRTNSRSNNKKEGQRRSFLAIYGLTWVILIVNILLLFRIETQLKALNKTMNQLIILQNRTVVPSQEVYALPDGGNEDERTDYVSLCGLDQVDKPMERDYNEILEKLGELAKDNEVIEKILSNSRRYPEKMLEALANNPEMADFVEKYLDGDRNTTAAELTDLEREQEYPLFLQWDPRWGYNEYGDDSNIGLAGCGPTCLSMVLYYLTGDESLTPDKIAEYSMENGYYVSGTGTAWALMKDIPALYGIEVSQHKVREDNIKNELDKGHIIICTMGPGDFTVSGHFIVIYGYDSKGFRINDPNCVARSRSSWTFEQLKDQIKNIWSYQYVKLR